MLEAAEQIQNPVVPDPEAAGVPEQSPERKAPEQEATAQYETTLSTDIEKLWLVHQDCQSTIKQETKEFRSLRSELGKLLHQMKTLLARPGRSGGWSAWLKERQIPRATADRLVSKHERSLSPDVNCLTESISEPTDAEIQTLLGKVAPKLRRVLRTPSSAYRFLDLLASSFALDRKDAEGGFTLLRPSTLTLAREHDPTPNPTELVPTAVDNGIEEIGIIGSFAPH